MYEVYMYMQVDMCMYVDMNTPAHVYTERDVRLVHNCHLYVAYECIA